MQQQIKKKRPLSLPVGIKQFILAAALLATLFGWQTFALEQTATQIQSPPLPAPTPLPVEEKAATPAPQAVTKTKRPAVGTVRRRVKPKTSRPAPVAVTQSSR